MLHLLMLKIFQVYGPHGFCPTSCCNLGISILTIFIQGDEEPFEVRLSDEAFETYELDPPPYTLTTTKKELKKIYYDMVSIR